MFDFLSGSKVKEAFAFNLLPPKSKDEIEEEAKQKQATVYGVFAPMICIGVALFIFFLDRVFILPTKNGWIQAVDTLRTNLNNPYNEIGSLKKVNGELKTKTDFIAEPVQKNVDFSNIFKITDEVFANSTYNAQPTSYGREDNGDFLVNAVSPNSNGPIEIYEKFKARDDVSNVNLRLVQKPEDSTNYRFTISFLITAIGENDSESNTGTNAPTTE